MSARISARSGRQIPVYDKHKAYEEKEHKAEVIATGIKAARALVKNTKKKERENKRKNNAINTLTKKRKNARQELIQKGRKIPEENFKWSIGDRYHDWWPSNRGDIQSYKKCGDFKFLPHMIHYIIICESISAFQKHYPQLIHLTLQYNHVDQPAQDVKILSKLASKTLINIGVSDIEKNILQEYTKGKKKKEFSILKSLFGETFTSRNNAIITYINICKYIFGDTFVTAPSVRPCAYFGVVCDAGISPFCKLFMHIIEKNGYQGTPTTEGEIENLCVSLGIPLMYMIQTPQTIADSAFTQAFIKCLTIYEFPENNDDTFECKFNYFADEYKIVFKKSGEFNKECKFDYILQKGTNDVYTIPYGLRDVSSSSSSSLIRINRNVGPSLYDLMLYYIYLNSRATHSIFNYSIYEGLNHVLSFNQLQFPEFTYDDESKDESKDEMKNENTYNPVIDNVNIVDRLPNIHNLVNLALGIKDQQANQRSLMTYKPTHPNSLYNIYGFKELPPKIMIDIKHEGDASQVVAAQIINAKGRFKDRIVFVSQDRPCVAHSVTKGLRTIQYGSNYINVYNSRGINGNINTDNQNMDGGNRKMKGGNIECELDVKELMLSIGMYADRYLETYITQKNKTIDDVLHRRVLHDFYDYTCNMYDKYNRDLEDDINGTQDDTKKFMNILSKIHYKEKLNSLQELINLSNIYNSNFKQPTTTFEEYTSQISQSQSLNEKNKKNLKHTQNVLNKMIQEQQNELNYYKNLKTKKNKNKYNEIIQQIKKHIRNTTQKRNTMPKMNLNQRQLVES